MTDYLVLLVFPALIIYSAVSDLLRMTISNRLSLAIAGTFLIMAALTGMPLEQIGVHVATGLGVLVIAFACFAFGWIGGGDAKVAAATAMWFGVMDGFAYLLVGSFLGGLLTLLLLQARTYPLPSFAARLPWVVRLHDDKTGVPYGIALAAAALLIYPDTPWMTALGA